eukprot:1766076-Lingulodinium_polyedra.AAC.1
MQIVRAPICSSGARSVANGARVVSLTGPRHSCKYVRGRVGIWSLSSKRRAVANACVCTT